MFVYFFGSGCVNCFGSSITCVAQWSRENSSEVQTGNVLVTL